MLVYNRVMEFTNNTDLRRVIAYTVDLESIKKATFFGKAVATDRASWSWY